MFDNKQLPGTFSDTAQDGSHYDGLIGTNQSWLSDCDLQPGEVTRPVRHRAHDEIWFVRSGSGQIWRSNEISQAVIDADFGTCLTIPAGTAFQFRTTGDQPFRFLIFQAPPWPSDGPGFDYVDGPWQPTHPETPPRCS